jgi:hypothetical protein
MYQNFEEGFPKPQLRTNSQNSLPENNQRYSANIVHTVFDSLRW